VRLSDWLKRQKQIVEAGGRAAHTLILEGPDQKAWGSWPIQMKGLEEGATESQRGLEAGLATGQHLARWVALDAEGAQIAVLPITLQGRSNDASTAAKDAQALQRATSAALNNAEQVQTMLLNQLTRSEARNERIEEDLGELRGLLQGIMAEGQTSAVDSQIALAREARMNDLQKQAAPILDALLGIVAERVVRWSQDEGAKSAAPAGGPSKQMGAAGDPASPAGAGGGAKRLGAGAGAGGGLDPGGSLGVRGRDDPGAPGGDSGPEEPRGRRKTPGGPTGNARAKKARKK
jgi:hypothetical protein